MFESHCKAIDGSGDVFKALKAEGLKTFSELAFAVGTPQTPASDDDFRVLATTIFRAGPTLNE